MNLDPASSKANSSSEGQAGILLGDRERALQRRFLIFASLLICILFSAAIIILLSAAQRANNVEVQAGLRTLNSVLNGHVEELRGKAIESAFWDDMFDQVESEFDPTWVDDNIGEFLHDATDVSLTVVIGSRNSGSLIVQNGERLPPAPLENLTPAFTDRLEALRQGPLDPPAIDAGYIMLSGNPYVFGMSPVTPEYPDPGYDGADRSIFMVGRELTHERLSTIADDFGLPNLRFTTTEPATPTIELIDVAGRPMGWLTWTPRTPGNGWLRVIFPGLAIVLLAVIILGVLLTQVWRSTLSRMREQERNLTVAVAEAVNASRAKTVFLASMSHELRTPLNAVIGFSNILKAEMFGPVGSPKYLEYVGDIHSTSNHLLRVIDSILDWAKLEAEQPVLQEEVCTIGTIVHHAITLADPKTHGVNVTTSIEPSSLAVRGDQTKLIQIVTNLLTNAVKASEPGQDVRLSSFQHEDGSTHIDVIDQGRGISKEVKERLFQPFQRSSDPYRTETTGVGLGLVVSLRLAELHQGSIGLETGANGGTIASLILPAERATSGQEDTPETDSHTSAL